MAIHLYTNTLTFDYNGGTAQARFYSDYALTNISLIDVAPWIHPSFTYDQLDQTGTIDVTVDSNTGDERTASIFISAEEAGQASLARLSINQQKGELSGEATIYKRFVDATEITSDPVTSITMNADAHQLKIMLKATTTIRTIDTSFDDTWGELYSYDIEPSSDVNYNIHTFVYDIEQNMSISRTANIIYDVTDVYGFKVSNYLEIELTQNFPDYPEIHVDDIYTDASPKTEAAIIRAYNVLIDNIISNDSWITNIISVTDEQIRFNVEQNFADSPRTGSITLTGTYELDPSVEIEYTFYIHQERAIVMNELPIWKDYLIDTTLSLQPETDVYYNVLVNGEVVYSGHAYAYDEDVPQINITEIVRDYLVDTTKFPRRPLVFNINNYISVDVLSGDQASDISTPVATLKYYYDYTFEDNDKRIRNIPVLNEIDPRQMITLGFLNFSGETNTIQVRDGMHTFNSSITTPGIHQFIDELHGGETINVSFAGEHLNLKVKYTCSKYCLYYLNPLGGWDSLIFDGKNLESEAYDSKLKTNDFINTTTEFGKQHYLKNINETYKLTTRYLTDDESRRMINVLRSPKAFLQDLETEEFFPVLINNKATDIKTFKNQGRKLYTYTLELETSQQKFIKN